MSLVCQGRQVSYECGDKSTSTGSSPVRSGGDTATCATWNTG